MFRGGVRTSGTPPRCLRGETVSSTDVIRVERLRKWYPPATVALDDVSLTLQSGEVHGLLGVNGAGKSTLIKILAGVERPDSGTLWVDGHGEVTINSAADSHALGIAVVHQELPLLGNLTAVENVFLGLHGRGFLAPSGRRGLAKRYEEVARVLSGAPPPQAVLETLRQDEWQLVAIIRALATDAQIVILDEPTSSLDGEERDSLHRAVSELADAGLGILYVSHFLDDVIQLCHVATVLRDARVAMSLRTDGLSQQTLLEGMTGEAAASADTQTSRSREHGGESPMLLEVSGAAGGALYKLDLKVRRGDRIGLFGPQGCGARDLLQGLFGLRRLRGSIRWLHSPLRGSTRHRIDAGIAYLPPDRRFGLMFDWSVADNLALPSLGARHGLAFVRRRANRTAATTAISRFGIVGRPEQTVRTLSGGNQQKLSLSKWMHGSATLLLADEPTRGVDVRGRRLIHEMLLAFAAAGNAFVMYSTDPEELEATCSRVVIVNDGRLTGRELVDDEITVERLEAIAHIHNPALAS